MSTTGPSKLDSREVRIGRILSEIHDCRAGGMALNDAKILAENPDIADDLRLHLDTLREVHRADHTIDSLIRQGILSPPAGADHVATLGSYKILGCIGRGGMGMVLEAFDESLRRLVAIKLLRPDLTDDATALARFEREARAVAAVSHENILTVHSVGEQHGSHYIVMQRLAGPSLADVIRHRFPLPANFVRAAFQQLLEGLGAAHLAGLIHRDIKPANLMFDVADSPVGENDNSARSDSSEGGRAAELNRIMTGRLKITDFGLARVASSQTRLTLPEQRFGTPQYMSPEQARGDADIDHRTDLYSAGVVLYEMLTGRTPFRADTPTAVVHQILANEPRDPRSIVSDCDPVLASIALRLMAKRREDRFESTAEALEALQSSRRVASHERRRRRMRVASISLLLVTFIAGATWYYVHSDRPTGPISAAKGMNNVVVVQYGLDTDWKALYRFPEPNRVTASVPVKIGASDEVIVVAGMQYPLRPDATIMAFDNTGEPIWSLDLSSDRQWPDCDSSRGWQCIGLIAADLDGLAGDEILAIATDIGQYATRFSIVDPLSREIRATLWHQGDLYISSDAIHKTFWLEQNFFGPGRHAIVCQGLNNKLDGFYEPQDTDPPPLTQWDIVPVVMIIDPSKMLEQVEGVAPPASPRLPFAPSRAIYAYAFLDLSTTPDGTYADEGRRTLTKPEVSDVGSIEQLGRATEKVSDESGPWFTVDLKNKSIRWGTIIFVDRDLNIRKIQKMPHDPNPKPESYWREKWKVVNVRG